MALGVRVNWFGKLPELKEVNPEGKIYRFIDEKYFWRFIQTREMYFNLISEWDDKWENPLKNYVGNMRSALGVASHYSETFSRSVYGTCWTYEYDTDALWRIYSPTQSAVCIQTTPNKLFRSITFERETGVIMAPVSYGPIKKTMDELSEIDEWGFDRDYERFQSFFLKREAFEHEKEIRFTLRIYDESIFGTRMPEDYSRIRKMKGGKALALSFDNLDFIEQVILDPRINQDEFDSFQRALQNYGIEAVKSTLYTEPKGNLDDAVLGKESIIIPGSKYVWKDELKCFQKYENEKEALKCYAKK